MLQNIRDNAQGTIAKIIVGVIALVFILFGTESIVGGLSGEPEVASVNGESITEFEFQQLLERKRRALISQMGDNYDPSQIDENELRKATLQEAITKEVLLSNAREAEMYISDAEVDQFIVSWPPAQVEGKFDRERFLSVLRNFGLSPLQFRQELKEELMLNQIRSAVAQTAFVLDGELNNLLRMERQERSFDFVELDAEAMAANIQVSQQELEAYYDENSEDFRVPEQVIVEYIEVDQNALAADIEVTDQQVQQAYESFANSYVAEEQRRASHILVEVNDEVSEEAALAKLQEAKGRLANGEDFSVLAKEYSDDFGSAQEGGDLGFANKGAYVPEFEEALYQLSVGEVSEPVKTDYGFHLIKLTDVTETDVPTYEESEERLRAELLSSQADEKLVAISAGLADQVYSADNLQTPAKELGLEVKTSEPFSQEGGQGLFSNPAVIRQAYSEQVLEDGYNSEVIEIGKSKLVVLRVKKRIESSVLPLSEVKDDIREIVAIEKAKGQLESEAETLVEQARTGDEGLGSDWVSVENAGRMQPEHAEAVRAAFTMPRPKADGIQVAKHETPKGYLVIRLHKVDDNADQIDDAESRSYKSFLASRLGAREFEVFTQKLEESAEIERL